MTKKKGDNMKALILILITISFIACTPKKTDPLNGYTTGYTRGLWTICFNAHVRGNPLIPPNYFIPICDCVIDEVRRDFSKQDLDSKKTGEMVPYFTKKNQYCFKKIRSDNSTSKPKIPHLLTL